MRSFWKVPTLNYYLWRDFLKSEKFLDTIGILWKTRGKIYEVFVNKKIQLNRGNALISVLLKKGMVGYNIGDFSVSKRMGSVIHKKKVKKKKKIGKKIRKGYLVNPIGFRLVFYGNWKDNWVVDRLSYTEFLHFILRIRRYLYFFFRNRKLIETSSLLGRIRILRKINEISAQVYIYNGRYQDFVIDNERKLIKYYYKLFFRTGHSFFFLIRTLWMEYSYKGNLSKNFIFPYWRNYWWQRRELLERILTHWWDRKKVDYILKKNDFIYRTQIRNSLLEIRNFVRFLIRLLELENRCLKKVMIWRPKEIIWTLDVGLKILTNKKIFKFKWSLKRVKKQVFYIMNEWERRMFLYEKELQYESLKKIQDLINSRKYWDIKGIITNGVILEFKFLKELFKNLLNLGLKILKDKEDLEGGFREREKLKQSEVKFVKRLVELKKYFDLDQDKVLGNKINKIRLKEFNKVHFIAYKQVVSIEQRFRFRLEENFRNVLNWLNKKKVKIKEMKWKYKRRKFKSFKRKLIKMFFFIVFYENKKKRSDLLILFNKINGFVRKLMRKDVDQWRLTSLLGKEKMWKRKKRKQKVRFILPLKVKRVKKNPLLTIRKKLFEREDGGVNPFVEKLKKVKKGKKVFTLRLLKLLKIRKKKKDLILMKSYFIFMKKLLKKIKERNLYLKRLTGTRNVKFLRIFKAFLIKLKKKYARVIEILVKPVKFGEEPQDKRRKLRNRKLRTKLMVIFKGLINKKKSEYLENLEKRYWEKQKKQELLFFKRKKKRELIILNRIKKRIKQFANLGKRKLNYRENLERGQYFNYTQKWTKKYIELDCLHNVKKKTKKKMKLDVFNTIKRSFKGYKKYKRISSFFKEELKCNYEKDIIKYILFLIKKKKRKNEKIRKLHLLKYFVKKWKERVFFNKVERQWKIALYNQRNKGWQNLKLIDLIYLPKLKYFRTMFLKKNLWKGHAKRLIIFLIRRLWGNFYNLISLILSNKLSVLGGWKAKVMIYNMHNNGITAEMIARFFFLKLKTGFTLMELVNPIRTEMRTVQKEDDRFRGFKFRFSGRFKRRHRSKKYVFGKGPMPLTTVARYIDYDYKTVILRNSICSIKIWLNQSPKMINDYAYNWNNYADERK